jgi:hypothetical protein
MTFTYFCVVISPPAAEAVGDGPTATTPNSPSSTAVTETVRHFALARLDLAAETGSTVMIVSFLASNRKTHQQDVNISIVLCKPTQQHNYFITFPKRQLVIKEASYQNFIIPSRTLVFNSEYFLKRRTS